MSWFWSSSSSSGSRTDSSTSVPDVYADLDPSLQAVAQHDRSDAIPALDRAPPVQQEDESLSDQMESQINSVRGRRAQVNDAAMFNCALAEYDLNQCFLSGSWWDRSKLCESQKGAFWKCLESNKKALQIMGYAEPRNTDAQNRAILEAADDLCMKEAAQAAET